MTRTVIIKYFIICGNKDLWTASSNYCVTEDTFWTTRNIKPEKRPTGCVCLIEYDTETSTKNAA